MNITQLRAEESAVRKFNKLVLQLPSCLQNHKPSVLAWLEGEMTLTAKSAYELSAVKEIFETLNKLNKTIN